MDKFMTIEARTRVTGGVTASTWQGSAVPMGYLSPRRTMALLAPPTPLYAGHPSSAKLWVSAQPELSVGGDLTVSARRPQGAPGVGSDVQWVMLPEHFDNITNLVSPHSGTRGYALGSHSSLTMPAPQQHSYMIRQTQYTVWGTRFSGDQYLATMFPPWSQSLAWTLSFVAAIHPIYAPSASPSRALVSWGVSGPSESQPEPPSKTVAITHADGIEYGWGDVSGRVDTLKSLTRYHPVFITMSGEPGLVRMTVSTGPRWVFTSTVYESGEIISTPLQFVFGKPRSAYAGQDYSLMEANMWSRALSEDDVVAVNAYYASIYGASGDR